MSLKFLKKLEMLLNTLILNKYCLIYRCIIKDIFRYRSRYWLVIYTWCLFPFPLLPPIHHFTKFLNYYLNLFKIAPNKNFFLLLLLHNLHRLLYIKKLNYSDYQYLYNNGINNLRNWFKAWTIFSISLLSTCILLISVIILGS